MLPVTLFLILLLAVQTQAGSITEDDALYIERIESVLRPTLTSRGNNNNDKPNDSSNHNSPLRSRSSSWKKNETESTSQYYDYAVLVDERNAVTVPAASSLRSAANGGEKATITVAIFSDKFPEEIGFILASRLTRSIVAEQVSGFMTEARKIYTQTIDNVREGDTYTLTITDSYGDGIVDPAFAAIFYGSTPVKELEIVRVGAFQGLSSQRDFVVRQPETPSPTMSQPPTASPAPTHSPTMCSPGGSKSKIQDEPPLDPHFLTADTVYGNTDTCKFHNNYIDCTNERSNDCQWQFIGTSPRLGVCRVDPVTVCLAAGNCVCDTSDFKGGSADMAGGILFHAPISVTARDVSVNSNTVTAYYETYTQPSFRNRAHPQDTDFFISKVDFTNRVLTYEFDAVASPVIQSVAYDDYTIAFKLHHLYWDTRIAGSIWNGLGTTIGIHALGNSITVNGHSYALPSPLKRWTCSSIVLTSTTLYVGRTAISRDFERETPITDNSGDSALNLGPFSGELFDVRIYDGALSFSEVREFGARCTSPDDPAALAMKRDLEHMVDIRGCDPDFESFHADAGGPVPTGDEGHTYGSGPFGTLWVKPKMNPFQPDEFEDISEGNFDEEHYFQQAKIQSYLWERYLFQADMMAFDQEPLRSFNSANDVPEFSAEYWNNPCRYINNFNNGWQYPIYGTTIPKWDVAVQGGGTTPFDLNHLYRTQGSPEVWMELNFISHEMFHGVQGNMNDVYGGRISAWIAESTAEYGSDLALPGSQKISASFAMAPSYPLGFLDYKDAKRGEHFMTEAVAINESVRGGHLYGSWVLWWFLADHAGLPHLVGQIHSSWYGSRAKTAGEIYMVRQLVENANLDFGDVWATFIAHFRTWDFPLLSDEYRATEEKDFANLIGNTGMVPPIGDDVTLEGRKTAALIDSVRGTGGEFIEGPAALRPGPNGWNCLTAPNVDRGRFVSIDLQWDDDMGFAENTEPSYLPEQQRDCGDDPRFYNNIVVAHNKETGQRRYWKLKGKAPPTLNIEIAKNAEETIHIFMVPTPPADYVRGAYRLEDGGDAQVNAIPVYSYKYKVQILGEKPNADFATEEEKEYGITKFDKATPGWWPVECTCLERPNEPGNRCIRPTFDGVAPSDFPSLPPKPVGGSGSFQAPPAPGDGSFCFSGESSVYVKNKGSVLMKDLKIGDEALVDGNTFSEVYSFGHRHESISSEYLQIFTDTSSRPLEISPTHMIFVPNGEAVPASSIRVGDQVVTVSKEHLLSGSSVVTAIGKVVRNGAYAPFTPSGTIVVDDVLASNYIAFQESTYIKVGNFMTPLSYHWIAHTFQFPQRVYCSMAQSHCEDDPRYDESGVSTWVAWPHSLALWLFQQNMVVFILFLLPIAMLLLLFSAMELMFFHNF